MAAREGWSKAGWWVVLFCLFSNGLVKRSSEEGPSPCHAQASVDVAAAAGRRGEEKEGRGWHEELKAKGKVMQ